MSLRLDTIRLAHANAELRPYLLTVLADDRSAASYQDYVERKKKEGEPPLEKDEWETRTQGGDTDDTAPKNTKAKVKSFLAGIKGVSQAMAKSVADAPAQVQQFVMDKEHRNKTLRSTAEAVRKSPKKIADTVWEAAKDEVHELKHAGSALAKVFAKPRKEWDKKDKKAVYGAAVYVAGAVATATTGGGAILVTGMVGKSFAMHVAAKALHNTINDGFTHFEVVETIAHLLHVASDDKEGDEGGEKYQRMLMDHLTIAVAAVMAKGISDEEMAEILKDPKEPNMDEFGQPKVAESKKEASLRSRIIRLAHNNQALRPHLLPMLREAAIVEQGDLVLDIDKRFGTATVSGTGSVRELAKLLSRHIVHLTGAGARAVPRPRGKLKAFSFHWSNAQSEWDVILATTDMLPHTDGSEFILFCPLTSLSPLGKPWSLVEMRYVAKYLAGHPGGEFGMKSATGQVGPHIRFNSHRKQVTYKYEDPGLILPPVTIKDVEEPVSEVKALVAQAAKTIRDEGFGVEEALALAGDVAEGVNYRQLGKLLGRGHASSAVTSEISRELGYGILQAAWFAVFLLQEFRAKTTAQAVLQLMIDETARFQRMEREDGRGRWASDKVASRITVPVRDLPPVVRKALKEVSYGRRDIGVEAKSSVSIQDPGGEGLRGFSIVMNLETEQYDIHWGSWGGPNAFNPRNRVDMDDQKHRIPMNGAVLSGWIGGGRPTYATLYVNPDNMQTLIPVKIDLTELEDMALAIIAGIKSGARSEYFERHGIGAYTKDNLVLKSLIKHGLVKATGTGIQITTEGKNAVNDKLRP